MLLFSQIIKQFIHNIKLFLFIDHQKLDALKISKIYQCKIISQKQWLLLELQ